MMARDLTPIEKPGSILLSLGGARMDEEIQELTRDFEAAARRPLECHLRNAFIRTYKPVLDDASFRAFDTMEDYRRWCEQHLPSWLGYGRTL